MRRLLVVNPNTTASMTEKIGAAAAAAASPGTEVVAVSPASGPASIEGPYDEAFCLPGLLAEIRSGVEQGFDAFVIACFDDPGLAAARALTDRPVLGIAEAAMHATCLLATGFSVVTTTRGAVPVIEELALRYGFERRCRRVRCIDLPVLALEDPASPAVARLEAEIARALDEDGAEAVILGCAGMADLTARLSDRFGVPVVDGVAAAVRLAEALVGLGLKTSKRGLYASPPAKAYAGDLARFAP